MLHAAGLADPRLAAGVILGGKYKILGVLGQGGMGTVLLAHHLDLDQKVAVKVLTKELGADPRFVVRFTREARAAVRLQSEHVARVTDVGTFPEVGPYIVMEYLEGQDLEQLLEQGGPLPTTEAVDYVLEALDAVGEAHSLGIIHRDLKPANLFLADRNDGSRIIKVLDFGISKLDPIHNSDSQHKLTLEGVLVGSPAYMSPEQLKADVTLDARADVWSLGVVLFQLLTADLPFDGPTLGALVAAVVSAVPTRVRSLRPDVPSKLEVIIQRCLERDLERRYGNVAELAQALAPFGSGRAAKQIQRTGEMSRRAAAKRKTPEAASSSPSVSEPESPRKGLVMVGKQTVDEGPMPRRQAARWVIGAVLLAGLVVLGVAASKPYLSRAVEKPIPPAAPVVASRDPKVQQFLSDGEQAMSDGNLDSAKENFDKASVLVDKDAHVLLDLAKLDIALADVSWLETKLDGSEDARRVAKAKLDEASPKARKAADDAYALSPNDPATMRVHIDSLRITGNLADARALSTRIEASQPEGAYVLAMLDLAEPAPQAQYEAILERLRLAAGSERNLGRARAALVYAMAISGDVPGARREFELLVASPRAHPLLGALRVFLDHSAGTSIPDAGLARIDAQPLQANGGRAVAPDLAQQAVDARKRGEIGKAQSLYGEILIENPGDSEALADLGDISNEQRDFAGAAAFYKRALAVNRAFLPAKLGMGNVLWETGDKPGARVVYEDIVASFREGSYPPWVKERANSGGAPASSTTDSGAPTNSP